jgi:hypothetical protein
MKNSLTVLTKKIRGFNKRVQTEADFWRLVERERINVDFWPLPDGGQGFYGVNRKYKRTYRYIVIDSRLHKGGDWLPTAFHELVHHFLHVPVGKLQVFYSGREHTRQDRQADIFSLVMRLPLPLFLELTSTPFDQIHGFGRAELIERKRIYETYGY